MKKKILQIIRVVSKTIALLFMPVIFFVSWVLIFQIFFFLFDKKKLSLKHNLSVLEKNILKTSNLKIFKIIFWNLPAFLAQCHSISQNDINDAQTFENEKTTTIQKYVKTFKVFFNAVNDSFKSKDQIHATNVCISYRIIEKNDYSKFKFILFCAYKTLFNTWF